MTELGLAVVFFTGIIVMLTFVILVSRAMLIAQGEVGVVVNGTRTLMAPLGAKLLTGLAAHGVFLPSACGGRGTCGQCRVKVLAGGGPVLPTEAALISPKQRDEGERLACQVAIKKPMSIEVPDDLLGTEKHLCTVRSTRSVATFIKELVFDLPAGASMEFRAGCYVQVECPPYALRARDFEIAAPYRAEWDHLNVWRYPCQVRTAQTRAYSIANYPGELESALMLNVRIATPPPIAPESVPLGAVSAYLFSLKPGDQVNVTGPFGKAVAREGDAEMVFIGGGAGMAPMRSLILDQVLRRKTTRRISFWYGARASSELFYQDLFDRLQVAHDNFCWLVALSDPAPEDNWTGATGFIHQVVHDRYLAQHPNPEACEYYICGPPVMNSAVVMMLEDLGVEQEQITLDDFSVATPSRPPR